MEVLDWSKWGKELQLPHLVSLLCQHSNKTVRLDAYQACTEHRDACQSIINTDTITCKFEIYNVHGDTPIGLKICDSPPVAFITEEASWVMLFFPSSSDYDD